MIRAISEWCQQNDAKTNNFGVLAKVPERKIIAFKAFGVVQACEWPFTGFATFVKRYESWGNRSLPHENHMIRWARSVPASIFP